MLELGFLNGLRVSHSMIEVGTLSIVSSVELLLSLSFDQLKHSVSHICRIPCACGALRHLLNGLLLCPPRPPSNVCFRLRLVIHRVHCKGLLRATHDATPANRPFSLQHSWVSLIGLLEVVRCNEVERRLWAVRHQVVLGRFPGLRTLSVSTHRRLGMMDKRYFASARLIE